MNAKNQLQEVVASLGFSHWSTFARLFVGLPEVSRWPGTFEDMAVRVPTFEETAMTADPDLPLDGPAGAAVTIILAHGAAPRWTRRS